MLQNPALQTECEDIMTFSRTQVDIKVLQSEGDLIMERRPKIPNGDGFVITLKKNFFKTRNNFN